MIRGGHAPPRADSNRRLGTEQYASAAALAGQFTQIRTAIVTVTVIIITIIMSENHVSD